MSMPPVFPQLAGQGWSVHKRPLFSTRVASHVSGREVRTSLYAGTLYEFELTFDALVSQPTCALAGAGATSMQTLLGFFLQCQGQFGAFLYVDPTDNTAANQVIGTGDGVTTIFPLRRAIGGFTEPVSTVTTLGLVTVDGVAQSGTVVSGSNAVALASTPPVGAIVAASFTYAFLCRFTEDQQDFENVMSGLWTLSSLKFRSIRP